MKNKKTIEKKNIFELLKELKDYRRGQGQRHPLQIVLLIMIMAIMAGAKSERAISRFAKNNKKELIDILKIERKEIPSRSVTKGMAKNLDFKEFKNIFYKWALQFIPIKKGELISMDGKAIRGTVTNANSSMQDFISLVSVFVSKKKQILMTGKINTKKENEIPTVRELIEMLDLQGVIFTLDALHCQKETVKKIIETKNDYIIGVKNNQKKLAKQLKKL